MIPHSTRISLSPILFYDYLNFVLNHLLLYFKECFLFVFVDFWLDLLHFVKKAVIHFSFIFPFDLHQNLCDGFLPLSKYH